ncbi:MAG: hypothetical protein ACI4MW_04520 [Christensenellales bacterium]
MKKSDKNVSKTINPGRRIQTRDDYLESGAGYTKPGYENGKGGNYRIAIVIATNKNDELAIVKLTTKKKNSKHLNDTNSNFKPYVETKDNELQPLKKGKKVNILNKSFSKRDTVTVIKETVKHPGNRNKIREMKGRPPLKNTTKKRGR